MRRSPSASGRTTIARALAVWLDGAHVADIERRRWNDLRCRYSQEALDRWPGNSPVISCSLPLDARPRDALAFCKGVLPEGDALRALAALAGVAVNDTYALLERFGRDIAGALVVGTAPEEGRHDVERYDAEGLERAVDALDRFPLGAHDDSELSLAGLQDKLLLVRLDDGSWARPLHGRPSTHILKVDPGRFAGLVAAERECLELARQVGLTTIEAQLLDVGGTGCIVVSRFDRVERDERLVRVHQEDLCQALGIDPDSARGRAKYQRAGGPAFADAASLLDRYAADPQSEIERLLEVATFTVLIGNADAHGKNLALVHPDPEHVTLAPLYDTVPTLLWPKLRTEAAMTIGGRSDLRAIDSDDLVAEARAWSLSETRAREVIEDVTRRMRDAISRGALPPGSAVAELVLEQAARLAP